jgi:hypothetical protein
MDRSPRTDWVGSALGRGRPRGGGWVHFVTPFSVPLLAPGRRALPPTEARLRRQGSVLECRCSSPSPPLAQRHDAVSLGLDGGRHILTWYRRYASSDPTRSTAAARAAPACLEPARSLHRPPDPIDEELAPRNHALRPRVKVEEKMRIETDTCHPIRRGTQSTPRRSHRERVTICPSVDFRRWISPSGSWGYARRTSPSCA